MQSGIALAKAGVMHDTKITHLILSNHLARITFQIETSRSMRWRRTLALMIFRSIKPELRGIFRSYITHLDSHMLTWINQELRGISLHQALSVSSPIEQFGFGIRMKRLEFGWSQQELARRARISRSRLSQLEHGHAEVSDRTRVLLLNALKAAGDTAQEGPPSALCPS
jgi:DNA-binding XRE family transcriptional regulator